MPDLNRAVCEKLGIPPLAEVCRCGHDAVWHNISSPGCSECSHRRSTEPCRGFEFAMAAYPELATEAGFFVLIAALHAKGYGYEIRSDAGPATALVYGNASHSKRSASTPQQALLVAAAAALGVQE